MSTVDRADWKCIDVDSIVVLDEYADSCWGNLDESVDVGVLEPRDCAKIVQKPNVDFFRIERCSGNNENAHGDNTCIALDGEKRASTAGNDRLSWLVLQRWWLKTTPGANRYGGTRRIGGFTTRVSLVEHLDVNRFAHASKRHTIHRGNFPAHRNSVDCPFDDRNGGISGFGILWVTDRKLHRKNLRWCERRLKRVVFLSSWIWKLCTWRVQNRTRSPPSEFFGNSHVTYLRDACREMQRETEWKEPKTRGSHGSPSYDNSHAARGESAAMLPPRAACNRRASPTEYPTWIARRSLSLQFLQT